MHVDPDGVVDGDCCGYGDIGVRQAHPDIRAAGQEGPPTRVAAQRGRTRRTGQRGAQRVVEQSAGRAVLPGPPRRQAPSPVVDRTGDRERVEHVVDAGHCDVRPQSHLQHRRRRAHRLPPQCDGGVEQAERAVGVEEPVVGVVERGRTEIAEGALEGQLAVSHVTVAQSDQVDEAVNDRP